VAGNLFPGLRVFNGMNFRHAARSLLKTPVFTITVVLTLALGIGANSAVFSAIDAVLLKPLPFPNADQLMRLEQRSRKDANNFVAPVRLGDWERRNTTFQAVTGYYTQDGSETSGDLPEKLKEAFVAPRFLEVLGISPALGRDFNPDETRFGGPSVALISDRFWRNRFHADADVIGKHLRFGQTTFSIVGVMPTSFLFEDRDVDIWSPVFMDAPYAQNRQATWFNVIGRLKPNATLEQARADMAAVQAALGQEFGAPDSDLAVQIQPLKETAIGGVRQSLWLLFGAVSLVLLIACTNIAALLLARAAQREQEVALRFTLGASRISVVLQLLAEAFLLSLAGAALGLALAAGASRAFHMFAASLPRIDEIKIDGRILLYTLASAIAATILCGIVPALRGSRDTQKSLVQASRTQVSGRNTIQWILVGLQVALAVTLLTGAGLLFRSFQELGRVSTGFDIGHVLTFRITGSWAENDMSQRARRTIDFLETIPGVERAATVFGFPGVPTEFPVQLSLVEGRAEADSKISVENRFVASSYFDVMGIALLAGEMCRLEQVAASAPVMVNRSFANKYFPGSDAVGHNLRIANPAAPPLRIVGVVADARETGINKAPVPVLYSCGASAQPNTAFLVRTRSEPRAMADVIRRKLRELEPARSVYDMVPLEERLDDAFAQNRLRTVLLACFALTAMSLAAVGLYGTLSYSISTRRREVGLRLALGARRVSIVQQFLARGLGVALIGCVVGLGLAAGFTRAMAGVLFGISPWDLRTWAGVIAIMLAVAVIASLLPSVRASRLDPMHALRDE
jgi:putative ABC transport system permease protein